MEGAVRAAAKEFLGHQSSKTHKKGKGTTFIAFCLEHYPDLVIFILERAGLCTRQVFSTEGAVSLFMNLKVFMHFLKDRIKYLKSEKERSKLETCLFMLLGSLEIVDATRCRASPHIKVTAPMRFFASDADLNFALADMGLVLDALYNSIVEAKDTAPCSST